MIVSGNFLTIFFSEFFTEELENGFWSTFRFYVQLLKNIVFLIFLWFLRGVVDAQGFKTDFFNFFPLGVKISKMLGIIEFVFQKLT